MQIIEYPSPVDQVRTPSPADVPFDRELYRTIDRNAAKEALAALHAAASRTREDSVVTRAITSADAILAERGLAADDTFRDLLRETVTSSAFLAVIPQWVRELRQTASSRPDSGACTIASALELWSWTVSHFRDGASTLPASDDLAESLCPLIAARALALEASSEISAKSLAEMDLRTSLSHVYAAKASAQAAATCAELVFGYRRHLVWDADGCATCFVSDDLDDLEGVMPGIASGARTTPDVIEPDGAHPAKAGPCARFTGVDTFVHLRNRLDGCLTGARIAKERAASMLARSVAR